MSETLSADEWAKRYGGQSGETLSADDFQKRYGGVSVSEAARASSERRKTGGDIPSDSAYSADDLEPKGFWSGVKDAVVPSGAAVKQLGKAVNVLHPLDQVDAITDIGKNVASAQFDQGVKAKDSYVGAGKKLIHGDLLGAEGSAIEGAGHSLAAAMPVIGPAAAKAGEDIKRGDIAYGAGEGTGLVGTMLAPGAAAKGVDAVTPAYKVTKAASFADNVRRIAAASPDAPTLTGILKDAAPGVAKGAVVAAIGSKIPGLETMVELLGGGKVAMAGWKALKDVPKTAAWKAANATMKSQFAKALTSGAIEDAVRIGGQIVAGVDAMDGASQPPRSQPMPAAPRQPDIPSDYRQKEAAYLRNTDRFAEEDPDAYLHFNQMYGNMGKR